MATPGPVRVGPAIAGQAAVGRASWSGNSRSGNSWSGKQLVRRAAGTSRHHSRARRGLVLALHSGHDSRAVHRSRLPAAGSGSRAHRLREVTASMAGERSGVVVIDADVVAGRSWSRANRPLDGRAALRVGPASGRGRWTARHRPSGSPTRRARGPGGDHPSRRPAAIPRRSTGQRTMVQPRRGRGDPACRRRSGRDVRRGLAGHLRPGVQRRLAGRGSTDADAGQRIAAQAGLADGRAGRHPRHRDLWVENDGASVEAARAVRPPLSTSC